MSWCWSLAFLSLLPVASSNTYNSILGYQPQSDTGSVYTVGAALEALAGAVGNEPRNWTLGADLYEQVLHSSGISLRNVLHTFSPSGGDLYGLYASYYGSSDYAHIFVQKAMDGAGDWASLTEKQREELTMKGVVLQGVLMASIAHLEEAARLCEAGATNAADFVDQAWALYASSETTGPIRLAEKRAPQFAVEAAHDQPAGRSLVNHRLLSYFQAAQGSASQGACEDLRMQLQRIVAQMQVPIIQGLLREAYEADPQQVHEHGGADGFDEVVEGWAFTRAVLPAIANCSTAAAQKIRDNMDTIALGPTGQHVPDGYDAVKAAVESTYPCLGISCAHVNAMVDPWHTGRLLWQPCNDSDLTTTQPAVQASTAARSMVCLLSVFMTLLSVVR